MTSKKKYLIITSVLYMIIVIEEIKADNSNPEQLKNILDEKVKVIQYEMSTMQWKILSGSAGSSITSDGKYHLLNTHAGKGISHQKRPWSRAADLGFSSNSMDRNVSVKKRQGGVINYGDIVALHVESYGWLRYQDRGRAGGINLGGSSDPQYVWQVGGGDSGDKLKTDVPFSLSLVNNQRSSKMLYCQRTYGINLGWPSNKCGTFWSKLSDRIWSENGPSKALREKICTTGIDLAITKASATLPVAAPGFAILRKPAIKECTR